MSTKVPLWFANFLSWKQKNIDIADCYYMVHRNEEYCQVCSRFTQGYFMLVTGGFILLVR